MFNFYYTNKRLISAGKPEHNNDTTQIGHVCYVNKDSLFLKTFGRLLNGHP